MNKRNKGFTLAELLIVVAIIAVLVAISIPIFSSQLEKSREATDLANVRAAYAEVMAAAITDEEAEPITVSLKQKQDDFQTAGEINIGGITKANTNQWIGYPHADGSAKVSYDPDLGAVINWNGGAVISSIGTRLGSFATEGTSKLYFYGYNKDRAISTYNSARADHLYELESGKTYTISCTYNIGENNNCGLLASGIILLNGEETAILDTNTTELYTGPGLHPFSKKASEGTGYKYTDNGDGTYTYTATFKAPETSDGKCYLGMNFFGRNLESNSYVTFSNFMTDEEIKTAQSQIQQSFTVEEVSSN